jgi:ubiquinone/menaquinone biosynthesis C-methylase UbiE
MLVTELYQQYGTTTELANWLDLGCGEVTLLRMWKRYFKDVAGCDVSDGMIHHCDGLNVRRQDSAKQIPFEDSSFDLVNRFCFTANLLPGC